MNFSDRIQSEMKRQGVTKFRLAKQLNVSPSTIANWLNGESSPNIERIRALADFFHVSTDYLLTGATTDSAFLPKESNTDAKLEQMLLIAFRKLSDSDKLTILQCTQDMLNIRNPHHVPSQDRTFAMAEADAKDASALTKQEIIKLKAFLKQYDE